MPNRLITNKIKSVIKIFPTNESIGQDLLTLLPKLLPKIEDERTLTKSYQWANITLILKLNKDNAHTYTHIQICTHTQLQPSITDEYRFEIAKS